MYNCLHGKELFLGTSSHSASLRHSIHFLEPKVHYCIKKSLSVHPILSQINLFHIFTFHFLQINFNVILICLLKWSHPSGSSLKISYALLVSFMLHVLNRNVQKYFSMYSFTNRTEDGTHNCHTDAKQIIYCIHCQNCDELYPFIVQQQIAVGEMSSSVIKSDPWYFRLRRCVVNITYQPLYHRGRSPQCPLYRSLGGIQNSSGFFGEEKSPSPLPGFEPIPPLFSPYQMWYPSLCKYTSLILNWNYSQWSSITCSLRGDIKACNYSCKIYFFKKSLTYCNKCLSWVNNSSDSTEYINPTISCHHLLRMISTDITLSCNNPFPKKDLIIQE